MISHFKISDNHLTLQKMLVAESIKISKTKSNNALANIIEEEPRTSIKLQISSENLEQILQTQEAATMTVLEDAKTVLHKHLTNPANLSPSYYTNSRREDQLLKYAYEKPKI